MIYLPVMRELVEKVIETEKKSANLVSEAREKAIAIQSSADREASGIIEDAHAKVSLIIDSAIKKAEEEAVTLQKEEITVAEAEIACLRKEMELRLEGVAAKAIELIIQGNEGS
jgi:vacuolar-type H+-ATPase subunit E/Vma4